MPELIVTTNIPLVDQDGVDHRLRKEIDLWANLTAGQQTAVSAIMGRIAAALLARYGPSSVVESVRYRT